MRVLVVSQRVEDQLMMVLRIVTERLLDAQLERSLNYLERGVIFVDSGHNGVDLFVKKRLYAVSALI